MNEVGTVVGAIIRRHRKQQHEPLRVMSARAGLSFGYLSEIETGTKQAPLDTLQAISSALGVTFPALLREIADTWEEESGGHDR